MAFIQNYKLHLSITVAVFGAIVSTQTYAQEKSTSSGGLEEIVVTAQKREQSVQDVPIAVTALSQETLQANRVTNVNDLSGLAPGVTVRPSAGGSSVPTFTIRGAVSFGVVPGSDKQISTYLDGVYISTPRGSIFELPDVERLEVLRGPQGTLFGRNATAGAISVTTRDPKGEASFRGSASVGNLGLYRLRASVDTPQFGPFSASFSYVRDYKRGDIRNDGAGAVWDRTLSPDPLVSKIQISPRYLGTKDSHSVFAALKFESGDFRTVYKFDWSKNHNTADGTGLVGFNAAAGATGAFVATLINTQPTPVNIAPDGQRPDAVNNSWVIPTAQMNQGHSLTSTLQINDHLSVKNILAYRKSYIFANASIDGVSALTLTAQAAPLFGLPASLVGSPFIFVASQTVSRNSQWSDELQVNFQSPLVTLTAGAVWFKSRDTTGTFGFQGTQSFKPFLGGKLPLGNQTDTLNQNSSVAAYGQAELHITSRLDLVGGVRVTHDKKTGVFTLGTAPNFQVLNFDYSDTRPTYLVGVNYKPTDDILVYAKFSTAYVSGGSVASFVYQPETAKSVEGGIKTELLDRKIRANLAVYSVEYKNQQSSASATLIPGFNPLIGTFLISCCSVKSKGFEFDLAAAPARGVTFGGSLGYSDTFISDPSSVNPLLISSQGGRYELTQRPKWTGGLWGQYESSPLWNEAYVSLRFDGVYQSKMLIEPNPVRALPFAPNFPVQPGYWIVNGRLALRDIELGGAKAEIAAWGKNINNSRASNTGLNLFNTLVSRNYVPARTYGLDLSVQF